MAQEAKAIKIGDRCPNCGGEMKPDPKHDTERLVRNHQAVAHDQRAHENYARQLRQKVDDEGVIYTCTSCGYSARLRDRDDKGGRQRNGGGRAGNAAGDRDRINDQGDDDRART